MDGYHRPRNRGLSEASGWGGGEGKEAPKNSSSLYISLPGPRVIGDDTEKTAFPVSSWRWGQ